MDTDLLSNLVNFKAVRELALKRKKKASSNKQTIDKKSPKQKDKSTPSKNKNKDKVLQTQTYKDKEKEKKEIIVKTKWENENNSSSKKGKNADSDNDRLNSVKKMFEVDSPENTILGKRTFDSLDQEEQSFLKFETKEEQEEMLIIKGEGLQSIDEAFNSLKKVKKGNENQKSAKEVQNMKEQLKTSESKEFEETEKMFAPWMSKSTSKVENPMIRLHNEIIDFVDHVGPSQKEDSLRKKSFEKLSETIKEVLPHATVKPFGSFVTNLYLQQSDIDVAVLEPTFGAQALLNKIAKAFMRHSDYECVNVIRSAKVPLVKIVEKNTGINFDISFNKMDGINQVQEIERALEYYPEMRYLIIVIKCFLKQRDLNETFQGGIGSFLLFCLALAFLREIRKEYRNINREDDVDRILLSEFTLKFLDFFANFDIVRKQILLANGGGIVDKYVRDYALSVMSPQDSTHDIGKVVFRVKEIFGIFKNRYHFMMNYSFKKGESVLKYLINGLHI